jgi:dipeptidyl aminopeptidase/acylaminoacyl peptidase
MREYRESYEQSDSSNKLLWIVLAIVGGVMVVGVLVCGGIGYLFYQALQGVRTNVAQAQAQMQVAMEQQVQVPELDLKDEDYAKARAQFKTKLVKKGPAPQQWKQLHPPANVEVLDFKSGNLSLKAWVNPPSNPGKRKFPGVLFLHGGYAFDDEDWEMTQPLREAGYVVLAPMLRGENGQAGSFTMFYSEVDDVLAAAGRLAKLPYVDDKHLYVTGHSAGGTLALLAAMTSPRFRAAASFSGSPNLQAFVQQWRTAVPFDGSDVREFEMRSPMAYATSFKCPVRLYYGDQELFFTEPSLTTAQRAKTKKLDVEAVVVPGDHMSSVPAGMQRAIEFFDEQK